MEHIIALEDLKAFCTAALEHEGMESGDARRCAEALAETDAYGTHSHGTKNLHNYIKKFRAGGMDIHAALKVLTDGPAYALLDAQNGMGECASYRAMEIAIEKARKSGVALVTVCRSNHFGAAGFYANMAAKAGMLGLCVSNVDPNMTAPGAKGMLLGNNPLAYAAPAKSTPSIFLDIAMSNVASLKVVQARKDGRQIPDSWIVDKDGLPTTDPSHYPEEGAMQPMAAHKGYGLSILVDLLTGALANAATSMSGEIVSWCFELDKPNNVSHAFLAVNPEMFGGAQAYVQQNEQMAAALRKAPKAQGSTRIYTPGEIEWERYARAVSEGIKLPDDVAGSIEALSEDVGVKIPWKA